MAITAQNAYDAYNRLKRDLTDVPLATFWEWCDFVNKHAYRKLKSVDPERYINQATTYSVSTSPSTQSLPADFRDIEDKECGFF